MRARLPPIETIGQNAPLRLGVAAALAFPGGTMTASGVGWPAGKRLFVDHSNAHIVFINVAVFIRFDLRPIFVFVIAPDAERAAQFFGQRRLAEQAGVFEPGEVGEIAQARRLTPAQYRRSVGMIAA
jgi:hypothetical protein